jgi:signal transduction histidine kinase
MITEDNGVGFSEEKTKNGIGLLNITSRLQLINGTFNYGNSSEKGTLITIKIPLENAY